MPTLNVILALLFLTGAQARYFWQHDDPQQTPLERLQGMGQVYLESAKAAVKQAVDQFDSSAMAQELHLNIGEKLETLTTVLREVKEQVAPQWQEIITELNNGWQNLKQDMAKDVEGIKAQIQPLAQKLSVNVQHEIANYLRNVKSVSQELHQLAHEKLAPVAEGFRDKVRTHVDEFRKDAAPYTKELEQLFYEKVQLLQQSGLSELTKLQTELQQHVSSVHEKYSPLWQKAHKELQPLLERARSLLAIIKAPEQEIEQQSP
ncbi:apolipoprotein A-I [Python bivittatus]|uniref:Apolipoprotein A-I n=1 Tax=Python bivittatus TaxID=176946 RepID=A0A9F3QWE1_PYTBI|nr:apolipoprotein A-I [Python bivittatus]XP_015747026.1 apolipoprotein A-I [Python bivittatus]